METVTRTILSAHLQTCKLLNKPFTVLPNSTLNQKFNIQANEAPATNQYPSLGYICIGNKGASYEVATGNYILTTPIPHLPRHAALYNTIPFIVRPMDDDIGPTERLRYRLRVPITVGGDSYVAYYLRTLNLDNVTPNVELRNVNDGVITSTPFEHELSDLSPTAPVITGNNISNPNGDYLVSTAKTTFILNRDDVENIMDACNIIYGDPRYAVINEIGLVTGVDKVVTGQFGSTTGNYTEVISGQIAAFISQYHALTNSTNEIQIGLNVGSVQPLLV